MDDVSVVTATAPSAAAATVTAAAAGVASYSFQDDAQRRIAVDEEIRPETDLRIVNDRTDAGLRTSSEAQAPAFALKTVVKMRKLVAGYQRYFHPIWDERGLLILQHLSDVIGERTDMSNQVCQEREAIIDIACAMETYMTNYVKMSKPEQFLRARKHKAQCDMYVRDMEEHRAALDRPETRVDVPEMRRQTSHVMDDLLAFTDRDPPAYVRVADQGAYEAVRQAPKSIREIGRIVRDDAADLWSGIVPLVDGDGDHPEPSQLRDVDDAAEIRQLALIPDTVVTNFAFHGQQPRIRHSSFIHVARGATADVYHAELYAGAHSIIVALKVQPKSAPGVRGELLAREMKLWPTLRHKHVLPFYGSCDLGDHKIALISPFMENGTMIKHLTEHPSLNRLPLIMQVLRGVHYLHDEVRVVHGDLKCENVLISSSGSALVSDFGLSTTIEANTDKITTTSIRNCHTIQFAAPELLFGDDGPSGSDLTTIALTSVKSKTVPSDVYALGMLIYQAYTLAHPWPGATLFDLILRIRDGNGPPRTEDERGVPVIPDSVWAVCSSMWKFSAGDRPTVRKVLQQDRALL